MVRHNFDLQLRETFSNGGQVIERRIVGVLVKGVTKTLASNQHKSDWQLCSKEDEGSHQVSRYLSFAGVGPIFPKRKV